MNWREAMKEKGWDIGGESSRRFTLLRLDQITIPAGRSYLVKGLIPRQGLIVAWGPPKCGKSFWAFDLAMHVALGREYRDRRVQQGPVVYVAAEGASGQGARVAAWRTRNGIDAGPVDFALLPERPALVADADQLIAEIGAQVVAPSLVVIDTLNRTLTGSESSDEDMTAYVQAADKIRDAFKCAVMVIHHCGHESSRPRGHTSLTGAADCQIAVKRDQDGKICTKVEWAKDFAEGTETVSTLEVVEVGTDDDGDPITSCVVVPSDEAPVTARQRPKLPAGAEVALRALKEAVADHGETPPACNHIPANVRAVKSELWRKFVYARNPDASQDAKQKAFKRASELLQAKNLVGIWTEWAWVQEQP